MSAAGIRRLLTHLPTRTPAGIARRLVVRADAARDARQWLAAAALYEEALRLTPSRRRIHIQCGHVLKEAGAFERAEAHYRAAARAMPDDADLALQTGHFFKTTGQLDEATQAYARALRLRPEWDEARAELTRLGGGDGIDRATSSTLIAELLPSTVEPTPQRDGIVVRQLGRELANDGSGRRVLRGVQAIRGWCIASRPIAGMAMLIDGAIVWQGRLKAYPLDLPLVPDQAKYVFNLWHDFATCPPGERAIELRFTDARGQVRAHRQTLSVEPQDTWETRLASDACVPLPVTPNGSIEDRVEALSSVVRPASRTFAPSSPTSILVQRVDQLGDLVCSEPALRRLRALFPAARLIGLVSSANVDLARTLGLFDALELVDLIEEAGSGRRTLAASAQEELRQRLAAYGFEIAIDFGEADASRPLLRLSGAPFLYGFRPRDFPWLSAGLEIDAPDPLDRLEASAHSRRLLALIEGLAALAVPHARIMRRDGPSPAILARFGLEPGRRYALLHTGARLPFSRWPHFDRLARLLLERTDLAVLMMREEGDPIAPPLSERLHVISGRLPFDEFDCLIAGAALFVGNDSGPKHLAALRGVPVVSLHMARLNWNEWGQEQTGVIVSRRVPCAGCGIHRHPEECGKDFACLRLIQPEEVLAAALDQLA